MKSKKLMSLVLAVIMVMMMLPMCALVSSASSAEVQEAPFYYVIEDGEASVYWDLETELDKNLIIPSQTNEGYPITVIDCYAFGETDIETVTIPNSVKIIAEEAFTKCPKLTDIIFEEGSALETIEKRAINYCPLLKSINLPGTIKTISEYAFSYSGLESIVVPEGVEVLEPYAFCKCLELKEISFPSTLNSVDYSAVALCPKLEKITVSENNTTFDSRDNCNAVIKTSDNSLISGCPKTVIPNSVKSIHYGAFVQLDTLESIVIPYGVEKIDESAFCNCKNLKKVILPETITEIDEKAFDRCDNLVDFELCDENEVCENYVANYKSTYAQEYALNERSNLDEISLAKNAHQLKDYKVVEGENKHTCVCSICGYIPENEDCVFKYKETIEPTCFSKGYIINECEDCKNLQYVENGDKLAHKFENGKCIYCGLKANGIVTIDFDSVNKSFDFNSFVEKISDFFDANSGFLAWLKVVFEKISGWFND